MYCSDSGTFRFSSLVSSSLQNAQLSESASHKTDGIVAHNGIFKNLSEEPLLLNSEELFVLVFSVLHRCEVCRILKLHRDRQMA